jgi:hypothetical protein
MRTATDLRILAAILAPYVVMAALVGGLLLYG